MPPTVEGIIGEEIISKNMNLGYDLIQEFNVRQCFGDFPDFPMDKMAYYYF